MSLGGRLGMKDFRILLKNLRPYAALFTLAFILMSLVGVFEAGRAALVKSIIDALSGADKPSLSAGVSSRVDVRYYLPTGMNALPVIAALLVSFTLIKGLSEYASNVLMWRGGGGGVVQRLRG